MERFTTDQGASDPPNHALHQTLDSAGERERYMYS
jgi:hypothetical protein